MMIPATYGPDDVQPWCATHGTVPRDVPCDVCGDNCPDDHEVIGTRVICPRCARIEEEEE